MTAPDLLYILGSGSRWYDNEIRYSLRSACENLPHAGVVVVGERPWFAKDITHIRAGDVYHEQKLRNSIHKLAEAIASDELGEVFTRMNDDFFFLEPVTWPLPVYHRGPLRLTIETHPTRSGYYFDAKKIAMDKLIQRGVADPLDYSVHYPITMEKSKVREVLRIFGGHGHGYLFGTIYANWHNLGGELLKEHRGRCPLKLTRWNGPPSAAFVSTDDAIANDRDFREWIRGRFPDPCRYEI